MKKKEVTIEIRNPEIVLLLIFLSLILILELRVTFTSPIAFGDEAGHTWAAQIISRGMEYPVWGEGSKIFKYGFSRPPLWNLLEAGFFMVFGFHESIVKFLTPFIASVLTGIATFVLVKRIYNKEIGLIASLLIVTIPSFVTYSVLFYTDILFVLYLMMFILTFILAITKEEKKYWILAGSFGALSFLTKTPGWVIFPIVGFGLLFEFYKKGGLNGILRNYLTVSLLFLLIVGGFFLRNLAHYNTPSCDLPFIFNTKGCMLTFDYNSKKEFQSPTFVGSEAEVLRMGVMNYLNFAYGNVWFVILALICGLFLMGSRKGISDILILLSILSFSFIFYLSWGGRAEDTARYTLGLVPLISIVAANYFERVHVFIKNYYKQLSLAVFLFIIAFAFANFRGKLEMMGQVKKFSPSFFEACNFVKVNVPKDAIFMTIWTHQVNYNCQRHTVGFGSMPDSADMILSGDLDLALSRLEAHGITHIFIQKFSISSEPSSLKYPISFVQFLGDNPEHFELVYENGPSLEQCLQGSGCDGSLIYQVKY